MTDISDRLLTSRRAKKLSQSELGEKVGVSRETIGKYERGEGSPSLEIACKIADILEVSLYYLAGKDVKSSYNSEFKELEQLPPNIKEKFLLLMNAIVKDFDL